MLIFVSFSLFALSFVLTLSYSKHINMCPFEDNSQCYNIYLSLQTELKMSDAEYIIQAEKAYKEALDIVRNTEGWSIEKEDKKNQVIVKMKKNSQGRKIYLCTVSLLFNLRPLHMLLLHFRPKLIFLHISSLRRSKILTASQTGTRHSSSQRH